MRSQFYVYFNVCFDPLLFYQLHGLFQPSYFLVSTSIMLQRIYEKTWEFKVLGLSLGVSFGGL